MYVLGHAKLYASGDKYCMPLSPLRPEGVWVSPWGQMQPSRTGGSPYGQQQSVANLCFKRGGEQRRLVIQVAA